jgi:chromosome segregation ATPase
MIEPHFRFEDLKAEELRQEDYVDPYYRLRRPIEEERLRTIYQQAFIFDLIYKFAKEYLPDVSLKEKFQIKNKIEKDKSTDTKIDFIKEKVIEYLFRNGINVEEDEHNKKNEKENDGIINLWSIDEINVLRKNFEKIKDENFHLKSKLAALQETNIEIREKFENLAIQTKNMPQEKLTLEQENERLYIRLMDLESRYASYIKELESNDKEMKCLNQSIDKIKEENSQLISQKLKLEYELKKREEKLRLIKSQLKLFYGEKLEKIQISYKKAILYYKEKLDKLNIKYESEKSEKEKARIALEVLRSHYMNKLTDNKQSTCITDLSRYSNNDKIDDHQIKIF